MRTYQRDVKQHLRNKNLPSTRIARMKCLEDKNNQGGRVRGHVGGRVGGRGSGHAGGHAGGHVGGHVGGHAGGRKGKTTHADSGPLRRLREGYMGPVPMHRVWAHQGIKPSTDPTKPTKATLVWGEIY